MNCTGMTQQILSSCPLKGYIELQLLMLRLLPAKAMGYNLSSYSMAHIHLQHRGLPENLHITVVENCPHTWSLKTQSKTFKVFCPFYQLWRHLIEGSNKSCIVRDSFSRNHTPHLINHFESFTFSPCLFWVLPLNCSAVVQKRITVSKYESTDLSAVPKQTLHEKLKCAGCDAITQRAYNWSQINQMGCKILVLPYLSQPIPTWL